MLLLTINLGEDKYMILLYILNRYNYEMSE